MEIFLFAIVVSHRAVKVIIVVSGHFYFMRLMLFECFQSDFTPPNQHLMSKMAVIFTHTHTHTLVGKFPSDHLKNTEAVSFKLGT